MVGKSTLVERIASGSLGAASSATQRRFARVRRCWDADRRG